jgi:hypothetical protein
MYPPRSQLRRLTAGGMPMELDTIICVIDAINFPVPTAACARLLGVLHFRAERMPMLSYCIDRMRRTLIVAPRPSMRYSSFD